MLRRTIYSLVVAAFFAVPVVSCATATTTADPPLPTADAGSDSTMGTDAAPTGTTCKSDTDCSDPGKKKCDPVSKTCQACVPNQDTCTAGNYCGKESNGNYACIPGCKTDPDCAALADGGVGDASADGGYVPQVTPACCNHVCSNTSGDAKNCGTCGNACSAGGGCCSSVCQDLQNSLTQCGACGSLCAPAHVAVAQCGSGACGYTACTAPFADCDANKANGCEADTSTDANNCGVCGKKCANGQSCTAGACVTCGADEVSYNGHCYYLDGSAGACDAGYARAPEAILSQVASLFQGKNYKHAISDFCCIWTSDALANWGMTYPSGTCNKAGPIQAGEPSLGGANCNAISSHSAKQLTFCGK